jgi:DMSO/TMAO reductase YedYZ molybdopterin-dependent catalytic subunit
MLYEWHQSLYSQLFGVFTRLPWAYHAWCRGRSRESSYIHGLAVSNREHDNPAFWEVRGYSNTADPWTDDRYSF